MASMAGHVELARGSKQLRQLFQAPNAAIKEDILRVSEASAPAPAEDLPRGAWLEYRKGNKQRSGAQTAPRSLPKSSWKKAKPQKASKRKMALIAAQGNEIGVTDVVVDTTFCPNVRCNRKINPPSSCQPRPPPRGRPFPPSLWSIPRKMSTRYNTPFPPP